MAVTRGQTAAMIDDDELTIAILPADKRHFAAGSGNHRSAPGSFDVLS